MFIILNLGYCVSELPAARGQLPVSCTPRHPIDFVVARAIQPNLDPKAGTDHQGPGSQRKLWNWRRAIHIMPHR
jgi:hypothetical protein